MTTTTQLQREAERHRQDLSHSLDGLRTVATPSYVTTEVLNLAKDSSVSIAKALTEQARANLIAALLIGAGLVTMLIRTVKASASGGDRSPDLLDKANSAAKSACIDAVRGTTESVRGTASGVQRSAADTAHYAGDLASDASRRAAGSASGVCETGGLEARNVTSGAHQTVSKAGELGSAALDTARTTAGHLRDVASSTASGRAQQGQQTVRQLADQAQQVAGTARNYVNTLAEEQPIVVAALGVAMGAALGAVLPMTEAERQYLGSASARLKQASRDTISKVAEVVKSERVGGDLDAKVQKVTGKVSAVSQEFGGPPPAQS